MAKWLLLQLLLRLQSSLDFSYNVDVGKLLSLSLCVCLLGPVLKYHRTAARLPGYQAGYKAARPRACQNKITSLARKHDKTSEFQQINVNFNCIHLAGAGPGSGSGMVVYESLRMENLSSQTGKMKICIPCIEQRAWEGGGSR